MTYAPRLFDHCLALYEKLDSRATIQGKGKDKQRFFEGSKLAVFRELGISQGYYSQTFAILTELGCIEQLQKGSVARPTVIALHKPPDVDEFKGMYRSVLTGSSSSDTLATEIEDIKRRLPQVEINSYIVSLEKRLGELDARLTKVERSHDTTREESQLASQT